MRLTQEKLKQIIKEELESVMTETEYGNNPDRYSKQGALGGMEWSAEEIRHNNKQSYLVISTGGKRKRLGPLFPHARAQILGALNDVANPEKGMQFLKNISGQ